jgi:membrane peptidoglycan carboxypeptidase
VYTILHRKRVLVISRIRGVFSLKYPKACKMGTTQDSWFMGITSNLVAGEWAGADK